MGSLKHFFSHILADDDLDRDLDDDLDNDIDRVGPVPVRAARAAAVVTKLESPRFYMLGC